MFFSLPLGKDFFRPIDTVWLCQMLFKTPFEFLRLYAWYLLICRKFSDAFITSGVICASDGCWVRMAVTLLWVGLGSFVSERLKDVKLGVLYLYQCEKLDLIMGRPKQRNFLLLMGISFLGCDFHSAMEASRNDENAMFKDFAEEKCLPIRNPISEEFSLVPCDVFQSWIFLQRFHKVLGLEKSSSLEELNGELSGLIYDGLQEAHISILQILVGDLYIKWKRETGSVAGCLTECEGSKGDAPILNQLTWTELAKRYSLLVMSSNGVSHASENSAGIDFFRCLHGDGGILCGALTGVAGLKVDMWLLMTAQNKIYGDLVNERIPDWVHELNPVVSLKTNVGSKIKNCIELSLDKCPPGWAQKELEHSISKGFFKGNASGPTKQAALDVVKHFKSLQRKIAFSNKRVDIYTYEVVIRQCRILLRRLAAEYGEMNKKKTKLGPSVVLKRVHFRTIDVKLATGVYRGSHRAFAEDVRELCRNFALSKLLVEFEDSYKNKIVSLHKEMLGCSNIESLSPWENTEDVLPEATWDDRVCKICVIDENDDRVLLCDQCDMEYHTYCLSPRLPRVPSGKWSCPKCASGKGIIEDTYQVEKETHESTNLLLKEAADIKAMMDEKDYWNLAMHERTCLLSFFCEEVLNTKLFKKHIKESIQERSKESIQEHSEEPESENPPEFLLECKFLGFDSHSKLYWIFDSGAGPWVVVSDRTILDQTSLCTSDPSSWIWYRSEMEIRNLMDYLKEDISMNGKLNQSVLEQYNSRVEAPKDSNSQNLKDLHSLPVKPDQDILSVDKAMTKATRLLQGKYGSFVESKSKNQNYKGKTVSGRKFSRCECLEPIFPTRLHCLVCHKSCDTEKELKSHGDGKCNDGVLRNSSRETCKELPKGKDEKRDQDSSISPDPVVASYVELSDTLKLDFKEGKIFTAQEAEMELEISKFLKEKVPVSSLRPLDGKSCTVLKQLKISLLDMEAALPEGSSKADIARKEAWRAFVKDASTIYEMVQAMIVFEDTIRADYLEEFWKQNFSSASAAANISTLAALSFRLFSLDASICYQKFPCHPKKLKIKDTKKVNQKCKKEKSVMEK